MCGITGLVDFKQRSSIYDLGNMQQSLRHRGPDDNGLEFFLETDCAIGLAQTRLSIIDISPLGHQPMVFQHLTIVLNGEVYNYEQVKQELTSLGHHFRSTSDTEVVLHAFAEWGVNCVERFIGMFAFVLYDSIHKKVYACRDRVGVKPLFYYWADELFLFASELKAFHKHPLFKKEVDVKSIGLFLQYGYVPGPQSIFNRVYKMEPGTWLILDTKTKSVESKSYWSIDEVFQKPILKLSYPDAQAELEALILSACRYRMVSDVPVGIFLSGGLDSTLVTALLQNDTSRKLKTFTIGFPDGVNEAPFAMKIAKYLGTDHTGYDCSESDAKAIIPDLAYYYDEPMADISAIPTILVSNLARKEVTVALSADGGDELFAGYTGYRDHISRLALMRRVPFQCLSGTLLNWTSHLFPRESIVAKRKVMGVAAVLLTEHIFQPKALVQHTSDMPLSFISELLTDKIDFQHPIFGRDWGKFVDERNAFLFNSFSGSLKDYLLVKVDRATMSVALEGREPLLDHRLIEFASQLPFDFKFDGKSLKRIVRDIVFKHVPKNLLDRPKTGFDLPIYKWLRGGLSHMLDELLDDDKFFEAAGIKKDEVVRRVKKFRNNELPYQDIIWRIIVLRLWFNKWMINSR